MTKGTLFYLNRLNDCMNDYAERFPDIRAMRDWMLNAVNKPGHVKTIGLDGKPILEARDVELELRELIVMAGYYRHMGFTKWTTTELLHSFCGESDRECWGTAHSAIPIVVLDGYMTDEDEADNGEDKWTNRMPRAASLLGLQIPEQPDFGEVHWCNDDLANALELAEIPPTSENVQTLRHEIENDSNHYLTTAMIERGWEVIYDYRDNLLNRNEFKL